MRILGLIVAAAVVSGCGATVVCGPGTTVQAGRCVPSTLVKCGDGTRLDGDACVPADPLACGPGTVASDGQCVPAGQLSCGPGTEEQAGVCVVLDPMKRVTVPEAPEPNIPPGKSARFTVPAIGAAPVVLGGVVSPPQGGAPDFDGFVFHATKLQRLRIRGTALGVPSLGFVLQPCKGASDTCTLDDDRNFSRFALALDERGASRDLVIPTEGDWILLVSDESNLTNGAPFGGDGFTYTLDVVQVPQPAPAPIDATAAVSGPYAALAGHELAVTAEAPLYDVSLAPPSEGAPFPGQRALWAVTPDGSLLFSAVDDTTYGILSPMKPVRVAFPPGKNLLMPDFVYALGDAPNYALSVTKVDVGAMGTLAAPYETRASLAGDGVDVYSVDLAGGVLLQLEMVPRAGTQITPRIELRNARYEPIGSAESFTLARWFDFVEGGRYYVVVSDTTSDSSKISVAYTMKASLATATPVGPVAIGTPATLSAQVLDASGAAWFAISAGNDADLSASVHPAADLDATVTSYPVLASTPLATANAGGAGADETVPKRFLGSGGTLLVKVAGTAGGSFDLTATAHETTGVFETEPNDDVSKADALAFDADGHASASGALKDSADRDCFSFKLTAAKTVRIDTGLGARGGMANTEIWLLTDTGGYTPYYNDDANGSKLSHLEMTLNPGGYVVRVAPSWRATATDASDYTLTVDAH